MDTVELVQVIREITISVTAIVGAVFTGLILFKQLPQVHTLVNRNFSEQKIEIAELRQEVKSKDEAALAKSEAREAPLA